MKCTCKYSNTESAVSLFNMVQLSVGYNAVRMLRLEALGTGGVTMCQKKGGLLFRRSCPLLADWVSEDMMDAKRL